MRRYFEQMFLRPLSAFFSSAELLNRRMSGAQMIDGMVSRMVHTLSGPHESRLDPRSDSANGAPGRPPPVKGGHLSYRQEGSAWETQWGATALTEEDRAVINTVEGFLRDGLALKRWWEHADATNSYAQRFPLDREFNRPAGAYGFFDQVQLDSGPLPIMGNVQEMFYDQTRSPSASQAEAAAWMRDQIREFVLHYFMRTSAFREPEAYVPDRRISPPEFLARLSWCPQEDIRRVAFGVRQLYYKLSGTR